MSPRRCVPAVRASTRAVLIARTAVGQYAFLADSRHPGWQQALAGVLHHVPAKATWSVIPIPDGHGPHKVAVAS